MQANWTDSASRYSAEGASSPVRACNMLSRVHIPLGSSLNRSRTLEGNNTIISGTA